MELTRLELTLEPDKEPLGIYSSSLMHGYIMNAVDNAYAEELHNSSVNQFAQHIERNGNKSKWIITTVTEEAKKQIILPLLDKKKRSIYIENKDTNLTITERTVEVLTENELMDKTYFADVNKMMRLSFVTPTSFKVNGRYQIYPTVKHILQSVIRKFDETSENTKVYQDGLIEKIINMVDIIGYSLHSTRFPLEGVKIPSFKGEVTLLVRGPSQLAALIQMLLKFGEYSGIGIKCAMGMGSVELKG